MMKNKVSRKQEITNTKNLEIIAKTTMRNLKEAMRKRHPIDRLRIITREIVKIEVNMITEITEITVTTETTTEEITVVTTTEDTIIMTEMIEMTDNITEEEGEEMTMIMTTMKEENTEVTEITSQEEIIKTELIDQRDLTNLDMMIIKKMLKKKKLLIKHHN